ncbi:hypothetical protein DL89DRAFT_268143 [Linderina pennispora]|uniref:Uncharacterized protein n=1 Tax=Linderina pennispora TaxID=61395 RepID=A0A1Y1W6F0_9FUNG|nr:uncharacterized protein DL89DRAFT_268143 [Linderina pennispora]ORX69120.1 hypothetical protein DL89DRAFT_268143 [Linderina pennispora]
MAMYGVARNLQKREMRHMSMPIPCQGRQDPPANRTAKHSATAALRPSTMWKRRDSPPLSHLQRIEARVRILVATGALRVGARALVPVLTQLAMVVWSTLHSLGASTHVCYVAYAVAIMLLSLQGTLDMALYYIFDTHSDAASHASLPYYFFPQHSSIRHLPATASSQQFWCRRSSDRKHATPMRTSSSSNPHRSAYKHPLQSAHHRSFSLSPGYDSALRKFTFNADSLNMRRAHNRTSNAMQSDTLHGSEHMAWSHIDTSSALSMRAVDTISVSQYSTHQQASFLATPRMQMPGTRPMPVLTGWEEVDLEDAASSPTDRSQDYATPDGTPCPSASPPD